jgi:hypothetical protein
MPIITVNVPLSTFTEVMALVSAQRYASPEQFLEIAAYNQLALERGTRVGDLVTRMNPSAVTQPKPSKSEISASSAKKLPKLAAVQPELASMSPTDYCAVVERFSIESLDRQRLPQAAKPEAMDDRIWGQVNRYLPMKVAMRWIAIEANRTSAWPSLTSVLKSLPADASIFGDRVRRFDTEAGRVREEMLSVGVPQYSDSADRFITQIVGRLTRSDKFHPGALFQYGLAALQDRTIALTDAGVTFACLHNPVIDGERASESLSEQEREFMVGHIFAIVTSEARDFRSVLEAISKGHSSPDALIAASRGFLPESWTDLARRTHVYGVLARMGQLGLVGKNWEGRRVSYVATPISAAVAK